MEGEIPRKRYCYNHYFYHEVKDLVVQRNELGFQIKHFLELVLIVLLICRFIDIIIVLVFNTNQSHYDPLVFYIVFKRQHWVDTFFGLLTFIVACVFGLYSEWKIYFSVIGQHTWDSLYDFTVVSIILYRKCERSPKTVQKLINERSKQYWNWLHWALQLVPWSRWVCRLVARLAIKYNFEDVHTRRLFRYKLTFFPGLSWNLRKNLLLLTTVLDIAWMLFAVSMIIAINCFIAHLIPKLISSHFHFYHYILLVLDIILIIPNIMIIVRNFVLIGYLSVVVSYVYRSHLHKWNERVRKVVLRYWLKPPLFVRSSDVHGICCFYVEYTRLALSVDKSNQKFIGPMLLMTLAAIIPFCIHFSYRIIYYKLNLLEYVLILAVVASLLSFVSVVLCIIAHCNEEFYKTKRYISGVQIHVLQPKMFLDVKYKFDSLADRLMEARMQIGASFGPIKAIDYTTLGELVLFYLAYMFAVFSYLRKMKQYLVDS